MYHSPVNVHVNAPRIVYVALPCTEPDWDGTATERTRIYLVATSVVTDLVTSLKFQPIRCAIMLCHFGRTRNGYVAT